MTEKSIHTVTLDNSKCIGCVNCMKRCPTEAIRVRDGKASVNYEKCIGCGECVRLCPTQAKLPCHDPLSSMDDFHYKIALPAPSLYGQFKNIADIDTVLNGLIAMGFDDVYEVARAAEYATDVTKIILDQNTILRPIISTACPAVLELIMMRFHNLEDHLINVLAPVDIAAKLAKERAISNGIKPEHIGVFFISPCPAKVYAVKTNLGVVKSYVDRVLSISEVYMKLIPTMNELKTIKPLTQMSSTGLNWAVSRGEANAIYLQRTIAVDGIENVIEILEALEQGQLQDIDFIELNACISGCVGGVMNVENPFLARSRLHQLTKKLPRTLNKLADTGKSAEYFLWERKPELKDVYKLDSNRRSAMNKLLEIEKLVDDLPHADCGLCGAPSCVAFAEDVVNGVVDINTKCPRL